MEKFDCTGVILAGGCNRRLPGIKKTFHKVGSKTIMERIIRVFSKLFPQVILVVNDPKDFLGLDALVVTDINPSRCSLAGLHAGLFYADYDWSYVTACDLPFLSEKVIRYLLAQRDLDKQIIIPQTRGGLEMLSALYHKSCLPRIETNLEKQEFMIKKILKSEKSIQIPPRVLESLDQNMRFAFNVNTLQDLKTARKLLLTQGAPKEDKYDGQKYLPTHNFAVTRESPLPECVS
ncbi:molybdenum cofactor guanylyltransferase [uncultured Desulfobacter sp.]|uniref:molybdenum cofactor guanylyltransferase n=1 Tax=uncultured Desulfobacter sp. TaxID=240139 RepID=UPI0029F49D12|nr:molybdenum cofactor guanylyltransferase [uncultured Desulfobacter sp.]